MSTSLPEDTHASRSHRQAKGKAKKTKDIYGLTSSTPFAQFDPDTRFWKTCEDISLSASETFSPTLPAAGILRNGKLFQRRRSARHIVATVSSSWPTPTASDHIERKSTQQKEGSRHSLTLPDAVKRWPTPRSSSAMGEEISQIQKRLTNGAPYKGKLEEAVAIQPEQWPTPRSSSAMAASLETVRNSPRVTRGYQTFSRLEEHLARRTSLTGKLNPGWVESLMGFPTGFTDLEDSATPSSLNSPNSLEG